MKDPRKLPYIYLISGIVAIGAALYFMTVDAGNIFDWFILGMGVVAIIRGVREYIQQHGGLTRGPKPAPAESKDPPAAGPRPGDSSVDGGAPDTLPDDKA